MTNKSYVMVSGEVDIVFVDRVSDKWGMERVTLVHLSFFLSIWVSVLMASYDVRKKEEHLHSWWFFSG